MPRPAGSKLLLVLQLCIALAAINRAILTRTERNLCFLTAVCAGSSEILALSLTGILSCITASLALLRIICKALLCIKLLLAGGEYELLSALIAY